MGPYPGSQVLQLEMMLNFKTFVLTLGTYLTHLGRLASSWYSGHTPRQWTQIHQGWNPSTMYFSNQSCQSNMQSSFGRGIGDLGST